MKLICLIFLILSGWFANARCDWPVPAYRISVNSLSGLSSGAFDAAMTQVENTFTPIFARLNCQFVLHRSWNDGTVNAQAWREGNQCHVEIFGGLARYPGMTYNGILQVAAHEVGHHLGGYPYFSDGSMMSVEGQADYYSTSQGMPAIGLGSYNSSLALATVLAHLGGEATPWRPGPQLTPVFQTFESHPHAQCRLDTYDVARSHLARPRCWFYK